MIGADALGAQEKHLNVSELNACIGSITASVHMVQVFVLVLCHGATTVDCHVYMATNRQHALDRQLTTMLTQRQKRQCMAGGCT